MYKCPHRSRDLSGQWERTSRPLFTVNLISYSPLLGQVVDLDLNLDLLTSVTIETDAKTGVSTVTLGECASDPASISLTLLDRSGPTYLSRAGVPERLGTPSFSPIPIVGRWHRMMKKSSDSGVRQILI